MKQTKWIGPIFSSDGLGIGTISIVNDQIVLLTSQMQGDKKVRSSVIKSMNKKYLFKLFFYYITYSPSLSITN